MSYKDLVYYLIAEDHVHIIKSKRSSVHKLILFTVHCIERAL